MRNPEQQKKQPYKVQQKLQTKVITRKNGTKRVSMDFSKTTSRTNPEFQRECDINNIVKLPLPPQQPLTYGDVTNEPTLREVFKTVYDVKSNFMKLPSDVRKLMDNDPSKLHSFLTDEKNHALLVDRGIIKPKKVVEPNKPLDNTTETQEPSKGTTAE